MTLRTRKPSGQVSWPLVLVEGAEKTGKSYAAYSLSADRRVGRTFVLDLGEGTADEYAELGPYEVIDHNGTYADIVDQVRAACAEPRDDGLPNVIVIDSITALWELLKDWAEHRARNSKAGRRKLAEDPDAEVDVSMNLWNDAKDRWYKVINILRRSDVIGVLVARAKEVAKVQGGQPVAGQTDYKIEAEKGTAFAVTVQVRMTRPHTASLVAIRSLHADLPARGLALPDKDPLAHVVFDVMGAGEGSGPAQITHGSVGIPRGEAKTQLVELLTRSGNPYPKETASALWGKVIGGDPEELTDDQWSLLEAAATETEPAE